MKTNAIFKIVCSENNQLILQTLVGGKKTPKILTEELGISYQDLSNRLKILTKHNLIKREPTIGREVYYSRNEEQLVKLKSFFDYSLGFNLASLKEYHENATNWDDDDE